MRPLHRFLLALTLALVLAFVPYEGLAEDGDGGSEGTNSTMWGQVFNPDGTMRSDLVDKGVIRQDVDWMPHIPFLNISLQAEFHVYATPDGSTVVLPSATTLFFMALNPEASGLNRSGGLVTNGAGWEIITAGALVNRPTEVLAQIVQEMGIWDAVADRYVDPEYFADALISGDNDAWSFGAVGDVWAILQALYDQSRADGSFYTAFIVYPPDMCYAAPGGCAVPPEEVYPQPTPPPSACAPAEVRKGRISGEARLLAPPYPMVVGQDPTKRGVDLEFRLTIEPTVYTWYEEVEHRECVYVADGTGQGCAEHPNNPYYRENTWVECVPHQVVFRETANWVKVSATLSAESREWILERLSIRYPRAYLHHPDWTWTNPHQAQAGFEGNTFVWVFRITNVQVADPGWYDLILDGHTSGTPVSEGRPFHIGAGEFPVYLITSTIRR